MRVVTTCHLQGLADYGFRWLTARLRWPVGTEFVWYAEGYDLPPQTGEDTHPILRRDVSEIPGLDAWKAKHPDKPKDWRFDVVRWSNKAFVAIDGFTGYDGLGVYLDADCVTYRDIPLSVLENSIAGADVAFYRRSGLWPECGLWLIDAREPRAQTFLETMRDIYFNDDWKRLPYWFDCLIVEEALQSVIGLRVNNLSGAHMKSHHPQALSELGKYIDHPKGLRKVAGRSVENKQRGAYEAL